MNITELSKYIWQLGDRNKDFNIKWTIVCRARPYSNITKRCNLCTTEKLMIINSKPDELRNKRSELISKCLHENEVVKAVIDTIHDLKCMEGRIHPTSTGKMNDQGNNFTLLNSKFSSDIVHPKRGTRSHQSA